MSRLQHLLTLPDNSDITEDIYINERLGTFTIKPMSPAQHSNYQKRCMGKTQKDGTAFDGSKFNLLVVVGQTVDPNLSDADFLSQANCVTAQEFVSKKFLAGEISAIASKIIDKSGFDRDINEDIEEAKN